MPRPATRLPVVRRRPATIATAGVRTTLAAAVAVGFAQSIFLRPLRRRAAGDAGKRDDFNMNIKPAFTGGRKGFPKQAKLRTHAS